MWDKKNYRLIHQGSAQSNKDVQCAVTHGIEQNWFIISHINKNVIFEFDGLLNFAQKF